MHTLKKFLRDEMNTTPLAELAIHRRCDNLKRSRDRDLTFYPIKTLAQVDVNPDAPMNLRYVVTSDYQMLLAPEGRPSKSIPQHLEMPNGATCIAAGNIFISTTEPRQILGINHQSGDFQPGAGSLLWPLTILSQNPEILTSTLSVYISQVNEHGVFTELPALELNSAELKKMIDKLWTKHDLRPNLINSANQQNTTIKYLYDHAAPAIEAMPVQISKFFRAESPERSRAYSFPSASFHSPGI